MYVHVVHCNVYCHIVCCNISSKGGFANSILHSCQPFQNVQDATGYPIVVQDGSRMAPNSNVDMFSHTPIVLDDSHTKNIPFALAVVPSCINRK